jgi:hypothetical protein
MLTSQGDQEQIYVRDPASHSQHLAVLSLTQSVDDTACPAQWGGTLFSTGPTNDSIDTVTGPFVAGEPVVVATPCDANAAPATFPDPPSYPANCLGTLNPFTGQVTAVTVKGATYVACINSGSPSHRRGGHVGWSRDGASAVTNFG